MSTISAIDCSKWLCRSCIGDSAPFQSLADRLLVRASPSPPRVKTFRSIKRKAMSKNWSLPEAFDKAPDLVGCAVVCNNLQDVARAADLLQREMEEDGLKVYRQDYIAEPKESGYRGIHLNIRLPVQFGHEHASVGCEVQVRTLLQETWSRLTHDDIYKDEQPDELRERSKQLSELLAEADRVAEEIRREVAKPRRGRAPREGESLDDSALAYLYEAAFGSEPPEYALRLVAEDLAPAHVRADGLDALLRDQNLRGKVESAYHEHARWDPDSAKLFRWMVRAAVEGPDAAVETAREDGREEWLEIVAIAQREVGADLPESWEGLVGEMTPHSKHDDPEAYVLHLAHSFDSVSTCGCGTTIVQADLLKNLVEHYGLAGQVAEKAFDEIEQTIISTGVETGSLDSSEVCTYCGYVLGKDE